MCYNVAYLTQKKLNYAKNHGASQEDISDLERQLKSFDKKHFNVSGFSYPELLIVTDDRPNEFQSLTWGFVPFFMRDIKHPNELKWNTLNCIGENMFETKSFKRSAQMRRCLIFIDGFYEPHHFNGVSYPFYIQHSNGEPLIVAGLWDDNELVRGVSLVTVEASPLLKKIHNEKKRMPLILPREFKNQWLEHGDLEIERILDLVKPYDDDLLSAHSVKPIRNNMKLNWISPGDSQEANVPYKYDQMPDDYYRQLIGNS